MQLLPGRLLNDRYEIVEFVGEGGFASVYRALDRELGRSVAVKILRLSESEASLDLARFQREARVLAQLSHPAIVSIFAFGVLDESRPFIVMEYLAGESFASYLRRRGPLGPGAFKNIFGRLCDALAYAHEAGIVHRDLNPGNIFILENGSELQAKLIDFGLSKIFIDEKNAEKLTQTGFLLGSPAYMSPEMARAGSSDLRSDIYSLGCIMFEAVCGRPPFDADTPIGLLFKQQHDYPEEPHLGWTDGEAVAQVKAVILRCLQKDPAMRFQSCKELKSALNGESQALHDNAGESNRLGIHGWLPSGKISPVTLPKKAAIATAIICLAVLAPVIFCWETVLVGLIVLCRKVQIPVSVPMETGLAEFLKEHSKPEQAVYLYEDMLGNLPPGQADSSTALALQLSASEAYLSCANRKEAAKHLEQAVKLSDKLELSSKQIMSMAMLLDRVFVEDKPKEAEIKLRASLLQAAAKCPLIRRAEFSKIMANFLFRTERFCVLNRSLPDGVAEAIVALLSFRHIVLNSVQDIQVDHIVNYVGGIDSKTMLAIATLRIANPGTAKLVRNYLLSVVAVLSAEGNSDLSIKNLQNLLLKYPDDKNIALYVYQQLAVVESQRGHLDASLAYLKQQRQIQLHLSSSPMDVFPIDVSEMRCYIDMGRNNEARRIRDRMIQRLPDIERSIRGEMPSQSKVEVDFMPFAVISPVLAQGYFISILDACYRLGDMKEFNDVFMRLSRIRRNFNLEANASLTELVRATVILNRVETEVRTEMEKYLLSAGLPITRLDRLTMQIVNADLADDKQLFDDSRNQAAVLVKKASLQEQIYFNYSTARYLKKHGSPEAFESSLRDLVQALPIEGTLRKEGSGLALEDRILAGQWFDYVVELSRADQRQLAAGLEHYCAFCKMNNLSISATRVTQLSHWLNDRTLSAQCKQLIVEILNLN